MSTDTHEVDEPDEPMESAATPERTGAESAATALRPTPIVAAGFVGGLGMGLIMDLVMGAMPAIAALYGMSSPAIGWGAHLVHSVVFAFAFAALLTRTDLGRYARTATGAVGLGAAYGLSLTVTAGWFVMPIWLNAVAGTSMPVPLITVEGLAAHLVYGLLLGGVYAVSRDRSGSEHVGPARIDPSDEPEERSTDSGP